MKKVNVGHVNDESKSGVCDINDGKGVGKKTHLVSGYGTYEFSSFSVFILLIISGT